ncbi:hypothetical protein ACJ41P_10435 [Azospirillum argentinense]|uniref:Uncharacterized protein n=1 Tax=Azospirillum argentinense TaxID=2970906 RepID=A0ABW8V8F4_9PROT
MKPRPLTITDWQAAQDRAKAAPRGKRIKAAAELTATTHAALLSHLKALRAARRKGPRHA